MAEKLMGRKKVPTEEAARLLGCSKRSLLNYSRRGLLHPIAGRGHEKFYYVDELGALREALEADVTEESLHLKAAYLDARTRALEKRLSDVESALGFDVPILSYAKENILAEYWRAEDLSANPVHQADVIRDFAKTLLAITEEFLELVQTHTDDREPWRVFLQAADALEQPCAEGSIIEDEDLAAAQTQLHVARHMFEQRAIQYSTRRDGERATYAAFPKTEPSIHQRVLARLPNPGRPGPNSN